MEDQDDLIVRKPECDEVGSEYNFDFMLLQKGNQFSNQTKLNSILNELMRKMNINISPSLFESVCLLEICSEKNTSTGAIR